MTATRIARAFAAALDAMVAFVLALAAVAWAMLQRGMESPRTAGEWPAAAVLGTGLVFFALRDVAAGASLAKWLLGLRVETAKGARPGLGSRLLRAPWSILPLAWLSPALEAATPWRVVAYTPSAAGVAARFVLAVVTLAGFGAAAFTNLRPGIGQEDALALAHTTLGGDPLLLRALGSPIEIEIGEVAPRRAMRDGAVFALVAHGPLAQRSMTVVARRVGDAWAIEEVFDIETTTTGSGDGVSAGGGAR